MFIVNWEKSSLILQVKQSLSSVSSDYVYFQNQVKIFQNNLSII